MTKRNPNPNWNQREAPHAVRQTPQGREVIWFRGPDQPAPEEYDYSVTHHTRTGWRVYFLLACFAAVPLCCLVRLAITFVQGGL